MNRTACKRSRVAGGYTLVELIISVGLFAVVMTLAAGAYLIMISVNQNAQALASGTDNLSFAVESMVRDIRTGTTYSCGGVGDCPFGANSFTFKNSDGTTVTYGLSGTSLAKTVGVSTSVLTDPSITITSLVFYVSGTQVPPGDYTQPHVIMSVTGTVSSGHGKTESFTIETGATMRGTDI